MIVSIEVIINSKLTMSNDNFCGLQEIYFNVMACHIPQMISLFKLMTKLRTFH